MALIVNLFGAPGAGKSTGAAYIFARLKMEGINAEYVSEFAKDKVWENNQEVFKSQEYIFGKQSFKISRCADKVDVIVTDSPILLSALYNHDKILGQKFNEVVCDKFKSYDNLNFLIERVKGYNPVGRHQTEIESDVLHRELFDLMEHYDIDFEVIEGDIRGYDYIVYETLERLSK